MSESELGTYLRSRREALVPERVGLPAGARRRAPGLRRAELATISGVSVDYLTRLEQGRDRNPSPQVLVALADALLLSLDERVHLRNLSKAASGAGALCPGGLPPAREVRATMRTLLDRLDPAPAALFNRLGETLAHTSGYERLAGPLGLLDGEQPASRVWFLFADERARQVYPDWDLVADERIAALKSESSLDDPHLAHLIEELSIVAGAPFTERLAAAPVPPRRTGVERLAHPEVGELRLSYETLDAEGQQLVVYLPADDTAAAALRHLTPDPRKPEVLTLTG
ncbi:transcriptional regulator with XRE-family HTH domain [Murinocardiopsis flavida]|uniref:Transcriptional regulator with XRE-family HTH domain n=1 Tax=Murinocardiopsis flavida TaxID=645275 RepID=A0A2P8D3F9_9ACTN|nr:helix-turn-helix domain-containing protein [Murinocardiopsis flavida]PSK91757.1 transcriptional regulator with XRE-family HTH domain [Murinocardiopsis flavida]